LLYLMTPRPTRPPPFPYTTLFRSFIIQNRTKDNGKPAAPAEQADEFDKNQFSLDDPTSPWLVVNKQRPLNPKEYEPTDLRTPNRSEEHTSELQSRENLVCRLLLEK